MDNQLAWLKQSLDRLQADRNIDHVFVTQHTPLFPNGGHVKGCRSMWFDGCNSYRPIIKGAAANAFEGAIDRRDAYLKMLLDHGKVKVVLAGHEHNYSRMIIRKGMPIYDPAKYIPARPLEIDRPIWQIVNGAVGASYHAKVNVPWNRGYPETESYLKKFSTQHALVFFHVHGKSLEIMDITASVPFAFISQRILRNEFLYLYHLKTKSPVQYNETGLQYQLCFPAVKTRTH